MHSAAGSATLIFSGGSAWWALLGVAPIAIHLLARRRAATTVFPTARFLVGADAGRATAQWVRDGLVLLLRCLMLAALGLAAAGPVRVGDATGGERLTVILLDASASMRAAAGHLTRFEAARTQADELLAGAGPKVILMRLSSEPLRIGTGVGEFRTPLRRRLVGQEASLARCEGGQGVAAALAASAQWLASSGESVTGVDLHILSDFQASQWRDAVAGAASLAVPLSVTLHAVGGEGTVSNVAIERADVVDDAQRGLSVEVTVRNFGEAARRTPIEVAVRGWDEPAESAMRFSGGGVVEGGMTATWRIPLAGVDASDPLLIDVEAQVDDLFDFDNHRSAAFLPQPSIRALLVSDGPEGDADSGATALLRALRAEGPTAIAVERCGSGEVSARLAADRPDVVILCETVGPDEAGALSLGAFVQEGGGVWWIADSAESCAALQRAAQLAASAGIATGLAELEWAAWRGGSWRLPGATAPTGLWFASEAARSAVEEVQIGGVRAVGATGEGSRLIEDEAGEAVLVAEAWGRGRTAALLHGVGREDSTLSRALLFAGLAHDFVGYLAGSEQRLVAATVGGTARVAVESALPTTEPQRAINAPPGATEGALRFVLVEAGYDPGVIRLREEGEPSGAVIVTVSPAESQPENLDEEALVRLKRALEGSGAAERTDAFVDPERTRHPLWPLLVLAALVFAGCESAVIGLLRRRRGGVR